MAMNGELELVGFCTTNTAQHSAALGGIFRTVKDGITPLCTLYHDQCITHLRLDRG